LLDRISQKVSIVPLIITTTQDFSNGRPAVEYIICQMHRLESKCRSNKESYGHTIGYVHTINPMAHHERQDSDHTEVVLQQYEKRLFSKCSQRWTFLGRDITMRIDYYQY